MKNSRRTYFRRLLPPLILSAAMCILFSGCNANSTGPQTTEVALVANPTEEDVASPSETAATSTVSSAKSASASPAPVRQMLALDGFSGNPALHNAMEALLEERRQSEQFPDYSLLFSALEPDERKEILLLADEVLYAETSPSFEIIPLPLEGNDEEIFFDADSGVYHIPHRELTDDELYSLLAWEMEINHTLLAESIQRLEEYYGVSAESALVNEAAKLLQSTYNIDVSSLEYYLRYYISGGELLWQLKFTHPNAHALADNGQPCDWYLVEFSEPDIRFERMQRGFTDISADIGLPPSSSTTTPSDFTLENLRQDAFWAQEAREIVEGIINPDSSIDEVFVQSFDGYDELILRAAMKDGSSYRLHFSVLSRLPSKIAFLEAHELPLPMDPLAEPLPADLTGEIATATGEETASVEEGAALDPQQAQTEEADEVADVEQETAEAEEDAQLEGEGDTEEE